MATHSLRLSRSGLTVEWRDDDNYWRTWRPGTSVEMPDPEWVPLLSDDASSLEAEVFAGESADPSWWLVELTPGVSASVSATLADGSVPLIVRLGPVLICEWVSTPQALHITVDGRSQAFSPPRLLGDGPGPFYYPDQPWPRGVTQR